MSARRFAPLLALLCAPAVSFLLPLVWEPSKALLTPGSASRAGVVRLNAQGLWGWVTVGGRFDPGRADAGVVVSVRGDAALTVRPPASGEVVAYEGFSVGQAPRELTIASDPPGPLRLEWVTVSWIGPCGGNRRLGNALVAWGCPSGLEGSLYRALLLCGVVATVLPGRTRRTWASPWVWWVGAAAIPVLFPSAFSPLTRLFLPGRVSLATAVFSLALLALIASVARGTTAPLAALGAVLVWGGVARVVAFPPSGMGAGDVDERVYLGMAEHVAHGRGFRMPDGVYKGLGTVRGDTLRAAWWDRELYLGVARRGEPTAAVPPLYPCLLASLRSCGLTDVRPIYALHALLGIATACLAGFVGKRLGGFPSGLASCALVLFHSPNVAVAGFVLTEQVFLFLLMLACALLFADRPAFHVASCVAIGLAGLTRSVGLGVAPLFVLAVAILRKERRVWGAILGALVLAATLAPWAVRNRLVMGAAIVGSTFTGKDLFMGNNAARRADVLVPDWDALPHVRRTLLRAAGFGPADLAHVHEFPVDIHDEVARDKALRRKALLFVLVFPGEFLRLTTRRTSEFAAIASPPEPWERVGLLPFLFWPSVCLVALAVLSGRVPRRGVFLLLAAFLLSAPALLSVAYSRYRLPADNLLFPIAGVGVATLVTMGRRTTCAPSLTRATPKTTTAGAPGSCPAGHRAA